MKTFNPKPKKCRNATCAAPEFTPQRPMQVVCGPRCASQLASANRLKAEEKAARAKEKAARAELRAAKERIKTRSEHMKEAQQAFNAYIRERDHDLPCISCGRHHKGQFHAGHYRTVGGSPELRFEPLNCHKQCAPCNNHKSGDIVNYRIELVRRIGIDKVEWLEGPHDPQKLTVDAIKEMKRHYRQLTRDLAKARERGGQAR